ALAAPERSFTGEATEDRKVAFLFCGAGSQYAGMGAALYGAEPAFRAAVDACLEVMDRLGQPQLRRWLFPAPADAEA
ncbi:acyltransferase domain-containing protein, partial [Klebsiella pneumoniae]|nr:acyltransferase domain-containing protein [Klebsiella pneumoniae]